MFRKGEILIVVGLFIMLLSLYIADYWIGYIEYKVAGIYHFDYAVRSNILALIGFASLLSGSIILILDKFTNNWD
ncbi:hypothetical protein ACJROX_27970 [Pseudalkalibacillus sp. A8]|uniref:hypothetical protein n=1 Tax=Pseudalkalibacillus sp. A8 TaxID=3382641 RepID=UPI0038B55F3B